MDLSARRRADTPRVHVAKFAGSLSRLSSSRTRCEAKTSKLGPAHIFSAALSRLLAAGAEEQEKKCVVSSKTRLLPSAFPQEPAKLIGAWGIYAFCKLAIAACSLPSQRPWPRNVLFNTQSTRREATSYCRTRGRLSCFYLERDSEEGLKSVVPRPTAAYLGCPSEGASRSEGQVGGFWLRSADV